MKLKFKIDEINVGEDVRVKGLEVSSEISADEYRTMAPVILELSRMRWQAFMDKIAAALDGFLERL